MYIGALPTRVQRRYASWRTGGLVLGLMSQAKQLNRVASYITTALCAGTFTCAAALIDVRLCINIGASSRENLSCVLFNVSDTIAYTVRVAQATVNAKEDPIDRKTCLREIIYFPQRTERTFQANIAF